MAYFSDETNELFLKVVYSGCAGAGKTTNLQGLFKQSSPQVPFRHFDLGNFAQSSPYFEFLPMSLSEVRGRSLRLHAYALPAHNMWETTLVNLMTGVDGIVHVVDSRLTSLFENERAFERLKRLLRYAGRTNVPVVLQFNHRDAATAVPVKVLSQAYGNERYVLRESVATKSIGVSETLEALIEQILKQLESPPR